MDIRKDFGTNRSKELEGVVIPLGDDGSSITVARAGGSNYQFVNALTEVARKNGKNPGVRRVNEKTIKEAEQDLAEVYADHVVMSWTGISEGNVDVPYSRANVVRMLVEYPEFFRTVRDLAENVSNFRVDVEEEAKN